jgi:hypothetical protein
LIIGSDLPKPCSNFGGAGREIAFESVSALVILAQTAEPAPVVAIHAALDYFICFALLQFV